MIQFDFLKILISCLAAILWGITYACVLSFLKAISILPDIFVSILRKEEYVKNETTCGGFQIVACFISFTVGFILISYIALDGAIRAYMLVLSILSFWFIRKIAYKMFTKFFQCLLYIITLPFVKICTTKH